MWSAQSNIVYSKQEETSSFIEKTQYMLLFVYPCINEEFLNIWW